MPGGLAKNLGITLQVKAIGRKWLSIPKHSGDTPWMSKPPQKSQSISSANSNQATPSPKRRRPKHDVFTDDLPEKVPITKKEIEVLERYLGNVLDKLIEPVDPSKP